MRLMRNGDNVTSRKNRQPATFSSLLIVIGLLLLYVLVRIHVLWSFPPFIDESQQIEFAQQSLVGHILLGARDSRLIVPWWLAFFQPYGQAQLWIVRTASILFSLVGLAGVYQVGRQLSSRLAGILAVIIVILCPYSFFFERIVLMDPYVATFGTLALLFSVRLLHRVRSIDAILCGLCLAGALGAKGTGIALISLPVPAVLFLPRNLAWKVRLRWLATALGTLALIWGPLYVFLGSRQLNYFSVATIIADQPVISDLPRRLLDNLRTLPQVDALYFSPFFLGLISVGMIVLIVRYWRIGLFLLLSAVIPTFAILAVSPFLRPRYILVHVPILIVAFAVAVGYLYRDLYQHIALRFVLFSGTAVAVVIWAVGFALPFQSTIWHDATLVTLPVADRMEYISADSSGYELDKVAAFLSRQAVQNPRQLEVIGLISNCHGLALYIPDHTNVTLECPLLNWAGIGRESLATLVNQRAAESDHDLWVVTENIPYASLDGVTAHYNKIITYDRPDGISHLTIYQVVHSSELF